MLIAAPRSSSISKRLNSHQNPNRNHANVTIPTPLHCHRRCRQQHPILGASSSDANNPERQEDPQPSSTTQPQAYAIPAGIPTAGAVFVLAGFLKILIVCFPYSTMAISMFLQGRADLGTWAAIKMLPIALGILALAKTIVDRGIHERKWFHRGLVVASVLALLLSRWAFARVSPSPLDPMIAAQQRYMAEAMAAEARRRQAAERIAKQRANLQAGPEEVRKELEKRGSGSRFAAKK